MRSPKNDTQYWKKFYTPLDDYDITQVLDEQDAQALPSYPLRSRHHIDG
ncbi:MAG: hypothetical protein LBI35_01160 [Burkholderiales bacterium]|jgi:hypothetical protein|nr:hypothetical protein [Burkholderiales bacterium]